MQVGKIDGIISSDTNPNLAITKEAIITNECTPNRKAAFRKFVAENNLQPQAMSSELLDLYIKYGNNPDGIPALLYAAKMGDIATVKLFIQHGADPLTKDNEKNTALRYALLSENNQLVEFFLDKGLDPNATNHFGQPIWYDAVKLNDIKSFELLINHGLKLKDINSDILNTSPTLVSLYFGSLDLLKLFLSNDADLPRDKMIVNPDPVVWTITSYSPGCGRKKVQCLKWLIQNGILKPEDLQTQEADRVINLNPEILEYLIDNNYLKINQKLNNCGNPYDGYPLHACLFRPESIQLLIKKGANVNVKTSSGQTPLHWAVSAYGSREYFESIKILLSNGADVNARDSAGRTPLKIATDPAIRRLLISYGAIE